MNARRRAAPDTNAERALAVGVAARRRHGDDVIAVKGAAEHNLRSIDVVLPRHALTVVTGVSGSGKSSLAFDTIYAEGQRQYVESLSPYVRRSLDRMSRPKMESLSGLSPTIAIRQHVAGRNPRSTVGTITEIGDYVRLLFSRAGEHTCLDCGEAIRPRPLPELVDELLVLAGTAEVALVLTPDRHGATGTRRSRPPVVDLADRFLELSPSARAGLDPAAEIVVATLGGAPTPALRRRVTALLRAALRSKGRGVVVTRGTSIVSHLGEGWVCARCGRTAVATSSQYFSPNTPAGMCPACSGLGLQLQVDPHKLIGDERVSIRAGAITFYGDRRRQPDKTYWPVRDLPELLAHFGATIDTPWRDIVGPARDLILLGHTDAPLPDHVVAFVATRRDSGLVPEIERLFRETPTSDRKAFYQQYTSATPCAACGGTQLSREALAVSLAGSNIVEVGRLTMPELLSWLTDVDRRLHATVVGQAAGEITDEVRRRAGFVIDVGLDYLALARPAPSLSAGEGQRLRIARQLGCGLVDVVYVLDEPSIGLHARDNARLVDTLHGLCDAGNTVVVVEHDAEMIRRADWLVDLGPGAGALGGQVLASGPPEAVTADARSLTGRYLRGECEVRSPRSTCRPPSGRFLVVSGARMHNLSDVTARFPIGLLTSVTGVSGSGKSSLVAKTLGPAVVAALAGEPSSGGTFTGLSGHEAFDRVLTVTQDPIGRSSRSTPATYCGAFDEIRRLFARSPDAVGRGWSTAHFSYNAEAGQCYACKGTGEITIGMHFLADVAVICPECEGRRYHDAVLEVSFDGHSIAEVLDLEVDRSLEVFAAHERVVGPLAVLADVGLGYLKLGQSCATLSGGEAQRLKLSRELGRTDRDRTLYLIDEPTTGLHFADVQVLLGVLHRLVDGGNTMIVVEHNLDLIKTSDWIVDLGPGGGKHGGRVVAEGPPQVVANVDDSPLAPYLRQALGLAPRRHRQPPTAGRGAPSSRAV